MEKKIRTAPERTDSFFMKEALQMAFNARIGIVLMFIVALALVLVIFALVSRPAQTVVIDRSTGQTYAPVGLARGVGQELLDRQLIFYSGQAIENFFNNDYRIMQQSRQSLYEIAGSQFREELGEKYANAENPEIKECVNEQRVSTIRWELHPRITMKADPNYTVFATIQRIVKVGNMTKEIKKINVRVDWGRLNDNVDYMRRPHSLVLMKIQILEEGSIESNEQLNRLGR